MTKERADAADGPPDAALEDAPQACATGKIRLYVSGGLSQGAPFSLGAEQSHYLSNVMRLKPGGRVLLFNGRDGEWSAAVETVSKRQVTVRPETLTRDQDTVPDLTLLFAPVKRARLDFLVQKATELGVSALRPVFTRRTIVSRVNQDRLTANVIEAAEQCGRLTVPEVLEPVALSDLAAGWDERAGRLLFCDEAGAEAGVKPALAALNGLGGGPWSVLIGPEGGFAPEERAVLLKLPGLVRASLGPRIMRADTAAIAALTLWQAALGDWR